MIKRVKKIPKYNGGTSTFGTLLKNNPIGSNTGGGTMKSSNMSSNAGGGAGGGFSMGGMNNAATMSNDIFMDIAGIDDNSQMGVTLNSAATGADIGGSIMPGWGHLIGGVAGATIGAFKKGSVDETTGEIQYGGIFGRSKRSLQNESNRIKNSNVARTNTELLQSDFYNNNPNVEALPAVLVAEGGIMRKPVDALVSKGELIYNPVTKKLSKVPGSKGKPNKADDVFTTLKEGDVVISNSPDMIMSNGKTPALNLMGMVDEFAKGGAVKAREAIIKKVVNWLEANRTKPQEYAKFALGKDGVEADEPIENVSRFAGSTGKPVDTGWKPYFEPAPKVSEWKSVDIPDPISTKKSFNWDKLGDNMYKLASIFAPLLDKEKAEAVQYQVPVAKYRSTGVNVDSQLRAIDESYALARYNQANISPNTGAGMAYGLQAAANRAKQRADVYNWLTNIQNELIGRNVDTYNDWSKNYAAIMNNVYDKAAANRAAARNINRQNRATALKNWGSILRNKKQDKTNELKWALVEPMVESTYSNDAYLKSLINEILGYGSEQV